MRLTISLLECEYVLTSTSVAVLAKAVDIFFVITKFIYNFFLCTVTEV